VIAVTYPCNKLAAVLAKSEFSFFLEDGSKLVTKSPQHMAQRLAVVMGMRPAKGKSENPFRPSRETAD